MDLEKIYQNQSQGRITEGVWIHTNDTCIAECEQYPWNYRHINGLTLNPLQVLFWTYISCHVGKGQTNDDNGEIIESCQGHYTLQPNKNLYNKNLNQNRSWNWKKNKTLKRKTQYKNPTNPNKPWLFSFFVMPSLNVFKKINFNKISIRGIFFLFLFCLRIKTQKPKFLVRP